ncbi:MAG: glucose-6-phosphate dehydrogenase [Planctomycetes bacterium]|nr:glucose-6-phosphate dehydrogenase [Planctomycetota bacterium]
MQDQVLQENPLTAGTPHSLLPQPCVLVIFGAAGDLSWRKLLPAIYNLNVDGVLPSNFAVVGFGIGAKGDPDGWIRDRANDGTKRFSRRPPNPEHWEDYARALFYVEGRFDDPAAYQRLKERLETVDQQFGIPGNRVYYLAVPPQVVDACVKNLQAAGMVADPSQAQPFTRVIIEKPIGRDLETAVEVINTVGQAFAEKQTYRIDHYLGKETLQNLLVLRFANSIFEPIWNKNLVDHVQITVAETEGLTQRDPKTGEVTGSRIGYYEGVGALRDMVQNHILQILSLTAMEPPRSLDADVVRDAKLEVLRCLRPLTPMDVEKSVVRAQYIAGDIDGKEVPGYRHEVREYFSQRHEAIPADSTTETFVAMRVFIDNWRWAGVPFYIRTGKRLPKRTSEVAVQFNEVPRILFNAHPEVPLEPTVLSLRVQPEEGLGLRLASKLPGPKLRIFPVKMEFNYSASYGETTPEAYERLLLDVMAGDATLFMRRDAVVEAWKFVMPILDAWQNSRSRFLPEYRAGTWGPQEADRLIEADHREWRIL